MRKLSDIYKDVPEVSGTSFISVEITVSIKNTNINIFIKVNFNLEIFFIGRRIPKTS